MTAPRYQVLVWTAWHASEPFNHQGFWERWGAPRVLRQDAERDALLWGGHDGRVVAVDEHGEEIPE